MEDVGVPRGRVPELLAEIERIAAEQGLLIATFGHVGAGNPSRDGEPAVDGHGLEVAAERVEPRLASFREELEAVAKAPVILAGSGSAYAVIPDVDSVGAAGALANRISSKLRVPATATSVAAHGVRLSA